MSYKIHIRAPNLWVIVNSASLSTFQRGTVHIMASQIKQVVAPRCQFLPCTCFFVFGTYQMLVDAPGTVSVNLHYY